MTVLVGNLAALPAAEEARLRVTFTGQALIKHDLRQVAPEKSARIAAALQQAQPHVLFTDLETAIDTGVGKPTRETAFFHATQPVVLDCLKEWGFNLLALGNNHAWDLGGPGILATIDAVKARGFRYAGTGATLAVASSPGWLETPLGRIALVAFASGKIAEGGAATPTRPGVFEVRLDEKTRVVDSGDEERVLDAIRHARQAGARLVIVYQHDHYWEPDNRITPEWKKLFARRCVEAGAGVFVSHGAPLLHGVEVYRGAPIFYDLGGLVFHTITAPGYYLPEVWESVIVDAEFSAQGVTALRFRPLQLNELGDGEPGTKPFYATRGIPTPATGAAARTILERLAKLSAAHGLTVDVAGDVASARISSTPNP